MSAYRHILIAIDFTPTAYQVVQRAKLLLTNETKLTILNVVEYAMPLGFGDDFTPMPNLLVEENMLVEKAKESLVRFVDKTGLAYADQIVKIGATQGEIIRIAEQKNVDLIVLGSHGRHGISLLLGSTANGVLHHAPCDVLAVRIKKE